ncbi:MAG: GNAT family N-acetyltransferase [Proteobacteria bacterium]|nr:GNAT family N-acetyltransferase [Pseudomonadota bacterium]
MKIRAAYREDFTEIWRIFKAVIAKGDTYVNDSKTSKQNAYNKWMARDAKTFIAEINQKIVGAYLIRPNQVDLGSHIANASYIVDENYRGAGIGKALALHSIEKAKEFGYHAMQFNFVVSTNLTAVKLWQSVGFKIIGTIPKAFNHKTLAYVDAYIMFLEL